MQSHAQVGINTTSPDAQLDIKASNQSAPTNTDGILIPRVDAFPLINPTAAQQGMMVYLMVTIGANPRGLYYWDNFTTSWIGVTSTANGDKDWYKVGTTSAPSSITDDMFHDGKVGIGNSTPASKLHVSNNSSGMTPNPASLATLESNSPAYLSLLSGDESGVLFGANGNATNGAIIYNTTTVPNGMLFRTNNNTNRMIITDTGNIALGSFIPTLPLQFPSLLGDKLSLYGGAGPHYGFGIQNSLLQMHSSSAGSDIAFGYGSSATFTENMRIKGNGTVGIGLTNPQTKLHVRSGATAMTPNLNASVTIEDDDFTFLNILSNQESGVLFGTQGISTSGGIVYSPASMPKSLQFRTDNNQTRMTISDVGNVAIGNFKADFPLHFGGGTGDKVSFFGGPGAHLGIGIQDYLLQIHGGIASDDIAFGYGTSAAMTEVMRIKGTGNVGIGTSAPAYPLQFKTAIGDKISLYGGAGSHYGFGVQGNLLQIHSDLVGSDIAFGYGSSGSFTEGFRIKGNGNVGIGLTNPQTKLHIRTNSTGMTPNPFAQTIIENNDLTFLNLLSNQESGVVFGSTGVATSGGVIYSPASMPNALQFRTSTNLTRMTISDVGNVGIGSFKSDFPLQFDGVLGDKISLFGGAGNHYGFGLQSALMQIHSAASTDDIAFGYGTSAAFTERMRIKGTGEVGIGTNNPTSELEVNGFTKLGTTAPAVKMIKLTGTTNAAQGSSTSMAHGLTSSKILAVNVLVEYSAGNSVPPSYTASVGYEFDYFISGTNITVINKLSNSSLILSKPIRVLVTYEE